MGRLALSGARPITLPPQDLRRVELGRVGVCAGLDCFSRRKEEQRQVRPYSRLPRAKRAFITRRLGRVKPINKVGDVSFPALGEVSLSIVRSGTVVHCVPCRGRFEKPAPQRAQRTTEAPLIRFRGASRDGVQRPPMDALYIASIKSWEWPS